MLAAVDALLILATGQQFDGIALAQVLGRLTTGQSITAARILGPLRAAAPAGPSTEISQALAALISAVSICKTKTPGCFADLLAAA
jgi:hypothetical protein